MCAMVLRCGIRLNVDECVGLDFEPVVDVDVIQGHYWKFRRGSRPR